MTVSIKQEGRGGLKSYRLINSNEYSDECENIIDNLTEEDIQSMRETLVAKQELVADRCEASPPVSCECVNIRAQLLAKFLRR